MKLTQTTSPAAEPRSKSFPDAIIATYPVRLRCDRATPSLLVNYRLCCHLRARSIDEMPIHF